MPRAIGRYRWLVSAGLVVALIVVAAVILNVMDGSQAPAPDTPEVVPADASADTLAADACLYLTGELRDDIGTDAPAPEVLERVDLARLRAREAATRDPRWQALAGGAGALLEALRTDDPDAALVAMRVITANCPGPTPAASP